MLVIRPRLTYRTENKQNYILPLKGMAWTTCLAHHLRAMDVNALPHLCACC